MFTPKRPCNGPPPCRPLHKLSYSIIFNLGFIGITTFIHESNHFTFNVRNSSIISPTVLSLPNMDVNQLCDTALIGGGLRIHGDGKGLPTAFTNIFLHAIFHHLEDKCFFASGSDHFRVRACAYLPSSCKLSFMSEENDSTNRSRREIL